MKRDLDLIRQLIIDIEHNPDNAVSFMDSGNKKEIAHLKLLSQEKGQAGFVEINEKHLLENVYTAKRLTFKGYEVFELIKDENRWQDAKNLFKEKGIKYYSFELLLEVLKTNLRLK